jgi:hypothetical protein
MDRSRLIIRTEDVNVRWDFCFAVWLTRIPGPLHVEIVEDMIGQQLVSWNAH